MVSKLDEVIHREKLRGKLLGYRKDCLAAVNTAQDMIAKIAKELATDNPDLLKKLLDITDKLGDCATDIVKIFEDCLTDLDHLN
ncbi:hypothetical protein [Archaeoglobus profundus]|uniref:Uncharacterized protein n=1 Tax=Archaeoglobus profundus (strain DSM 5631 / JCM 9629 / NBRC 100127 / Av18) TaxID=572546 RepID=D2REL5_ARCPA|nr:hypothetical protein [Archaeoglobus profundus]ADB58559.1 hypothetical protein Arcpr_1513 [Archaeoglobus profundus DSM 5631]